MKSWLASFVPHSTELKSRILYLKKKKKRYGKYLRWRKKNDCIGDYIEIILSPSRHSPCLPRDSLMDKI